eukprot:SAG31_NODE_1651_length_7634_cov_5.579562_2_plen_94_part_00
MLAAEAFGGENAKGTSKTDDLRAKGIYLAGEKYMFLRGDEEMIVGKKGQQGCSIYVTEQALVIATYDAEKQHSPANHTKVMGQIADTLKNSGY